jgi:amidase
VRRNSGEILRNCVLPGALIRAEDYVPALRWRALLAREQAQALKRFDALLAAGALNVADPVDPNQPDRLVSSPSITMPFSVGGLPALAIPCGFSRAEGLPLSLQVAAAPMASRPYCASPTPTSRRPTGIAATPISPEPYVQTHSEESIGERRTNARIKNPVTPAKAGAHRRNRSRPPPGRQGGASH